MAVSRILLSKVAAVLFTAIISSVVLTEALTKPSAVRLVNNGYTGIEVAIHEDEPENRVLIDAIKRMFVKASPYLYTATNKRAYFREVTILIPSSWSDDPSYESVRKETFDGADIIVAPRNPRFAPDDETPASPYTKHFEGCGKQAIYIHFTSRFLLDDSLEDTYGDFGRVLVHEWGHFRWGLFNEYHDPLVDGTRANYFYHSTETGLYEPVACPRKWNMTALKYTGDSGHPYRICSGSPKDGYEDGCLSIPAKTQPEFSSSIMFGNLPMEQIIHFCDNDTNNVGTLHNSEADNKHNRLCGGRSSWEVMREHDDFRDDANPSRDVDNLQPSFKLVRVKNGYNEGRIALLSKVYTLTSDKPERRDFVSVDPTVGLETKFTFSYFVHDHAVDVVLISPSGEQLNNSYHGYNRDSVSNEISVSIEGVAKAGTWCFIILNRNSAPHEVAVSVSSLPSTKGVEPIVIKSFLSGTDAEVTGKTPFVAYAEVREGFNPIIQARVIATIMRPRTADGSDLGPVEMVLQDNGAGFDVTKNDGVYTKSFTEFTGVGYYGISVRVENDGKAVVLRPNRGSRIDPYFNPEDLLLGILPTYENASLLLPGAPVPENVGVKAPNFTRGISAGASRVSETPVGWTPELDILSPGKIFDLSVASSDFDSATVNITFTAPGDDLDSGAATEYIILRSNSSDSLKQDNASSKFAINHTDILYGNLSSPSAFGTEEKFSIRVPIGVDEKVASFFFAIFAEDEQGNRGELSNIVQATLRKYIPPPPEETTTPTPTPTTTEITSQLITTPAPIRCRPKCVNGGICTEHGRCKCPQGYAGRACQRVVCLIQCLNGGSCSSPYECKCRPGYAGRRCQTPICSPTCLNGGQCIRPGRCICPSGFSGKNCAQAQCKKPCRNGGYCARPDLCRCRPGFQGKKCEIASCYPRCMNGGRCVGVNRCSCTSGYQGKACEKPKCASGCKNGGTCLYPNVCLCRPGFSGGSCHIRN